MSLERSAARELIDAGSHGVLGTLHATRGIDLTPIVYAVDGDLLGSPVDVVKLKSTLRLQRERNLESDARASLLVEHWDRDDWSQLWWARAELRWIAEPDEARQDALAERLAATYVQYRDKPFATVLVFEIGPVAGWAAAEPKGSRS